MTDLRACGGRVETTLELGRIATEARLRTTAVAAIASDELLAFDRSERPEEPPLLPRVDDLPGGTSELWSGAWHALRASLKRVAGLLVRPSGLPVLKASYMANCERHHLSFAGIGATAVCKGEDPALLGGAVATILRARYRGVAVYYRRAHPSVTSLDLGLLAVEHLPHQRIWGTLWGAPGGFVCHCSLEDCEPRLYATFLVSEDRDLVLLPDWFPAAPFEHLKEAALCWTKSASVGGGFDLEFCVSCEGVLTLTQWRPLPEPSARLLGATLTRGSNALGPSPFERKGHCQGRLVLARSLPKSLPELAARIRAAADEVWVVPYRSCNEVDLFRLLVAALREPEFHLPPLAILHRPGEPLGHLHALVPEDANVGPIFHRWETAGSLAEGEVVLLPAWASYRRRKTFGSRIRKPMQLVKPPAIQPGDRIGVFSPSSGSGTLYPMRWRRAIAALSSCLGVKVVNGNLAGRVYGYASGSPRERAEELMSLLRDPSIAGVIAAIGGFNANGLLEWLDPALMLHSPKVVIGYSDADAVLLGLHAIAGMVTFHGPALLPQFGEWPHPDEYTSRALRSAVCGTLPLGTVVPPELIAWEIEDWGAEPPPPRPRMRAPSWESWQEGHADGPLLCGNVETLNALVGSAFLPSLSRTILFVEATGAEAYLPRFERALTHLRIAGMLSKIAGLVIARCPDAIPVKGRSLKDVVLDIVSDLPIPVAGNVDFGHTDPILTLPNGCQSRLVVEEGGVHLSVEESGVAERGTGTGPVSDPR